MVSTLQMGKLQQRDLPPAAAGHSVIDRNIQDCPAPVISVSINKALLRILSCVFLFFTQHSVCKPCPHCYLTLSLWLFATSNRPEDTSVCESFYPEVDLLGRGWGAHRCQNALSNILIPTESTRLPFTSSSPASLFVRLPILAGLAGAMWDLLLSFAAFRLPGRGQRS